MLIALCFLAHVGACATLATCSHIENRRKDQKHREEQLARISVVVLSDDEAGACTEMCTIDQTSGGFFGQFTGGNRLLAEALRKGKEEASQFGATHLRILKIGHAEITPRQSTTTITGHALKCPAGVKGLAFPLEVTPQ